jgi:hypothetical protein
VSGSITLCARDRNALLDLYRRARDPQVRLRAERRIGELLAETVRPGNPQLSHDETIGRLPEGVSRSDSHRWRHVASLPKDLFEKELAEAREPSTASGARKGPPRPCLTATAWTGTDREKRRENPLPGQAGFAQPGGISRQR